MNEYKTMYLGFSIREGDFAFSGINELNVELATGWKVTSVAPGELLLTPTGERNLDGEKFTLNGWKIPFTLSKLEE